MKTLLLLFFPVFVLAQTPDMTVTKDDHLDYTPQNLQVGDVISYAILVTNTGNVTLTNIEVSADNAVLISANPISSLSPGSS